MAILSFRVRGLSMCEENVSKLQGFRVSTLQSLRAKFNVLNFDTDKSSGAAIPETLKL
jgi:hypothetical protein